MTIFVCCGLLANHSALMESNALKTSYLQYNDTARDLVKSIADQLGLSMNQKHEIVIASMLAVAKAADGEGFAWIVGNENHNLKFFSQYPNVGVKVIIKVRSLLMEHGFIWDLDKIKAEHYDNQIMDIFGVDTDELAKMMGFAFKVLVTLTKAISYI